MLETEAPYLRDLNPRQREGVLSTEGPLLVIAGAGSGKTKMLTTRIVHLLRTGKADPRNILAVTFTNKAAGEMRSRVATALGLPPESLTPPRHWASDLWNNQPTIGTFHSICVWVLRREMAGLPFTGPFQILDDSDQLSLVKNCFQKLNLSDKMFSPKNFQYAINQAKSQALEPQDINVNDFNLYDKNLLQVYELYQREMYQSNVIDFGEIITLTHKLFQQNPDVLKKYQDLFRYIHVDEYQDTNRAQYLLVNSLASAHRNLCVVGDEDQSIYKWRGADIKNILDFEKDYSEAKVVKLEQNYRSTKTIINASSRLIAHNSTRKPKTLWTDNREGDLIQCIRLNDERHEAEFVVKTLQKICSTNYAYGDVAVFYRTNAQSRVIEDVLRREKIPYRVVGGLKFYERKEIKDVLAYFRTLANPSDSISLKRIINVPQRGIGKTTVENIEQLQFAQGITFRQAIDEAVATAAVGRAALKKLADFTELLENLRLLLQTHSLTEFYQEMLERTGYLEELRLENSEESRARIENLQEFDSMLADLERETGETLTAAELLGPFLESVTLATDVEGVEDPATGMVSLMTLHTSKGLEFPIVFMVGLEEGLFPSIRRMEENSEEELEEERRLCYVGMTRAKEHLYITHVSLRQIYGNFMSQEPSRFLEEIPEEYVEFHNLAQSRPRIFDFNADYSDDDTVGEKTPLRSAVGRKVRHAVYGEGVIRGQEGGSSPDAKVTIEFSGRLVKKFVLKFANLEFLN